MNVEEARKVLADAKLAEEADAATRRAANKPVWRYTISLDEPRVSSFDTLFDDDSRFYKISSELLNREEAKSAGWADHYLMSGGMRYVYNTLNRRIVCSVGGGSIFISDPWSAKVQHPQDHGPARTTAREAMAKVNELLIENPLGGDITHIINKHKGA